MKNIRPRCRIHNVPLTIGKKGHVICLRCMVDKKAEERRKNPPEEKTKKRKNRK